MQDSRLEKTIDDEEEFAEYYILQLQDREEIQRKKFSVNLEKIKFISFSPS